MGNSDHLLSTSIASPSASNMQNFSPTENFMFSLLTPSFVTVYSSALEVIFENVLPLWPLMILYICFPPNSAERIIK